MSLLSPSQLTSMRSTLNRSLWSTATIQRATTQNVGGEQTETWTDVAIVPCRIAPIGGGETGEVGGRIADETTNRVTFEAGTEITEADRMVIDGTTYEVTMIDTRSTEISRRVQVKEAV